MTMDIDHSKESFSRKGSIIRVFHRSQGKEAVGVQLLPQKRRRISRFSNPTYLILEYESSNKYGIDDTFTSGYSFARVLKVKRPDVLKRDAYVQNDVKVIGFADVRPVDSA